MCLLILQKEEAKIKEKHLKNAYDNNSDGVGYSYIDDGNVTTKKFRKYKKFLKNWNYDVKQEGSLTPFLLHFRLATHGVEEGTFNVHPFTVRQGLVFAHNGIINEVANDKKLSDTQVFNRDILKGLKKSFLKDPILLKLVEGFIGSSKLVFLDRDKSYKIVNEDSGEWDNGVWYSNGSYKARIFNMYKPTNYGYGHSAYYGNDTYWMDEYNTDRDTKQAKESTRYCPSKEQCGWCGDMVDKLTHTNIADMYEDEKDSYIWMCDGCVELEDEYAKEEESYNIKVAPFQLGGTA